MAKARVRIASDCEPASRTAVPEKNYALAVELDKLLCGDQGVLPFLDNCGSVLSLDTVEDVLRFSPPEVDRESDKRWFRDNRDTIVQATRNLYFLLHPGGQFSDGKSRKTSPSGLSKFSHPRMSPRLTVKCLNCPLFTKKRETVSSRRVKMGSNQLRQMAKETPMNKEGKDRLKHKQD